METDEAMELLVTEFGYAQRLQQGLEEARAAANSTYQVLGEKLEELRAKETKRKEPTERLRTLNAEKSTLLARTLQLRDKVSSLKAYSEVYATQRNAAAPIVHISHNP